MVKDIKKIKLSFEHDLKSLGITKDELSNYYFPLLTPRQEKVMRMREEGRTFKEISANFDVCRSYGQVLYLKTLGKLRTLKRTRRLRDSL